MHLAKTANTVLISGNFYFKVDPSNQIFLIYTTCIKVDKLATCLNGHRSVVLGLLAYRSDSTTFHLLKEESRKSLVQNITEEKVIIPEMVVKP